jgi:peptidoglycan/xylan/chitin deacetylase (PgdA/CDA1 family)
LVIGLVLAALCLTGCGATAHVHKIVRRKSAAQPPPAKAAAYLDRVPTFGPRPPAVKVKIRTGNLVGDAAAWLERVPTDQPVAFLTIDDGWIKRPEVLPLLERAHVPVTLFLTVNAVKDNVDYYKKLQAAGAVIEDHTITHTKLEHRPYPFQRREICAAGDQLGQWYGRRPLLFRPPFGAKDANTLKAVHDCGLRAAFSWKETVDKGVVHYQAPATKVERGDIILMHFRDEFVDDFVAALRAIKSAGLVPALLEDYVT